MHRTPRGERSESRGVEAGASERDTRLASLRLRLKPKTGPLPSMPSVAVALELATGNELAIQGLPSGGAARKRARALCDRIIAEGLLNEAAATQLMMQPMDDAEPMTLPADLEPRALASSLASAADRLPADLHVQSDWVRRHAPSIQRLEVSSVQLQDHALATRTLRAHFLGSESMWLQQRCGFQYRPAAFLTCACFHAFISLNSERGDFMTFSKSASLRYCSFLVGSTPAGRPPLSSSYEKVFEPGAS